MESTTATYEMTHRDENDIPFNFEKGEVRNELTDEDDANMEEIHNVLDAEYEAKDSILTELIEGLDEHEVETETESDVAVMGLEISTTGNLARFPKIINGVVRSYLGSIFANENLQRIVVLVKFGVSVGIGTVRGAVKNIGKKANEYIFDAFVTDQGNNFMKIVFTRRDPNELPRSQTEIETEVKQEIETDTELEPGVLITKRLLINTSGVVANNAEVQRRIYGAVMKHVGSLLDREDVKRVCVPVGFSAAVNYMVIYSAAKNIPPKRGVEFSTYVPPSADEIIFTRQNPKSQPVGVNQETIDETKWVAKRLAKRVIERETKREIAVGLGGIINPIRGNGDEFMENFHVSVGKFLDGNLTDADTFIFTIITQDNINSESIKTLMGMTPSCIEFDCDSVETEPLLVIFNSHKITIRRKHRARGIQERKRSEAGEVSKRRFYKGYLGYLGYVEFDLRDSDVTNVRAQKAKLHRRVEKFVKEYAQKEPIGQTHTIVVKVDDLSECTDDARKFVFDALKSVLDGYTAVRCMEEAPEGRQRVFAMVYRRNEGRDEEEL